MYMKYLSMLLVVVFWAQMNVSAYTPRECPNEYTASGVRPVEGTTIAADDLPFGARVYIYGKPYIVQDRFGGGYHNRVDIFMNNYQDAVNFGRQQLMCRVEID